MTIYTVTSTDDIVREPLGRCVIGSYTTLGRALDECTGYIMERLEARGDLAWSMAHDENHPETEGFFSKRRKGGLLAVRKDSVEKLREFLRGELGRLGCYYICDGESSWHFDIDENGAEGGLWTTVTWGDSDCEEPEFTTPRPETFTSEEAAIYSFYCYALDLKRDNGVPVSEGFRPFVYDTLRRNGKCRVSLSDGCSVSCVLYHDDMKNIRG